MNKKPNPDINSTIKYCLGITFLHFLHLLFKFKYEIKGILSNQLINFLHFGQKDLPHTKVFALGNL